MRLIDCFQQWKTILPENTLSVSLLQCRWSSPSSGFNSFFSSSPAPGSSYYFSSSSLSSSFSFRSSFSSGSVSRLHFLVFSLWSPHIPEWDNATFPKAFQSIWVVSSSWKDTRKRFLVSWYVSKAAIIDFSSLLPIVGNMNIKDRKIERLEYMWRQAKS